MTDGRKTFVYPDGTTYEGEWKGNKRHGFGVWIRPDGTRYVGEWTDNKPNGEGILFNADGSKYTGAWKEGKRHGRGMMSYADGSQVAGEWKEGRFAGEEGSAPGQIDQCAELEKSTWELEQRIKELEGKKNREKKRLITFKYLRKFNLGMGLLHLIQGGAMLTFALLIDKVKAFKTPIWSYFLEFNTELMRLVTRPEQIGEVPFAMFVSFFLFLSALAHFIIVMPKTNEIYNRDLEKGINVFRWYEYALSSSLMIILIAMLFGVYDIGALIAIFVLNATMNLFGLMMEKINQYTEKTDWSPFVFGCIAGIGPWIIIIMHALGNANPAEVPWFVYAIIGSYFVFFNLFPINMILQYKKIGRWADYLYGERGYIILSLVAKSVLAWLVFFGVMQPS
ncbi:MAG TPA: hypothetical protein ENN91_05580 [Firmicutes bacterium]|nr:hypothetical protein [Bacillota bacterium]